ncbi:uncharacterized protein LOC142482966 isoform X2 [Ascaphus truei]|uniref:uncharacterized protein LOC142482966 isoform X2 n=1 Tax=Ascaphus truei TaxID=8439 RepID=UPI003F59CB1B
MEKMYSANPHFIRCIKPNSQKKPQIIENESVLCQLRYNGLMETLRIRRDGFSWRPSFQDFCARFGILLLRPDVELSKESCLNILQRAQLSGWQCGKSRLFFKYWHQDQLSQCLSRLMEAATVIQKCYKALLCRRKYRALLQELRAQEQQRLQEEQQKKEEQEAERERKRLQEQESGRSFTPPVPVPRRRPLPARPCSMPDHLLLQPPVPRPRSKLLELSPFDNPRVPVSCTPSTGSQGEDGGKMHRRRSLLWFQETQAKRVLRDGAFPRWLHGLLSRRGQSRCRHYMIDVQSNGCYVILGEDRAHASLRALVQYHRETAILPFGETLGEPCGQRKDWEPDYEELQFLTRTLSLGEENSSSLRTLPPSDR